MCVCACVCVCLHVHVCVIRQGQRTWSSTQMHACKKRAYGLCARARVCEKMGASHLVKHADACVQEKGHMGTEVLVMLIRHFGK
jgi:hypothetical protein